jgi:predicted solute-binding protein
MKTKQSIKIIKRGERAVAKAAPEQEVVKKSAQESARDMVATVSSWVNEFQQRRRDETTQALKTLFADTAARPTGA